MSATATQPQFFGRAWSVQLDTVQTNTLRVQFEVHKTMTKEPNRCKLSVYNLAENTRSQLRRQWVAINISAGYAQIYGQIFSGQVRAIEHLRDGTQWISRVTGGDGEVPIRCNQISKSWNKNTLISTVLTDLANAACATVTSIGQGLGLGNVATIAQSNNFRKGVTKFSRGYTAHGNAYDALYTLSQAIGYQLSVQDGQLKLVSVTNADVAPTIVLNQQSGLVGSPQIAERILVKATALMNGSLYPGRKVQLQSARYDALCVVQSVTHKGDSHGNDWVSELMLRGLSNPLTGHPEAGT